MSNDFEIATDTWIKETTRNNRIIDLCLCIPVSYTGNVPLSDEFRERYMKLDYAQALRECIADNIRIDDIATMLGLPVDGIERIMKQMVIGEPDDHA